VRLGFDAVRKIALTTSVFSMFQSTEKNLFNRTEFWRHSISVGLVALMLVNLSSKKREFNIPAEDIQLVGLLHDIGKIIFEQYFHPEFNKILAWCKANQFPLFVVEEKVFRISHSELGSWLAKRWNLQDYFLTVIQNHHHPEQAMPEFRKLCELILAADHVVNKAGIGESGNGLPPTVDDTLWASVGLEASRLDEYLAMAQEESKKAEILLSL